MSIITKTRWRSDLRSLAIATGASDAKMIPAKAVLVEDHLASFCVEPRCQHYGQSLSCPPQVGGPAAFRRLQAVCEHAMAVRLVVPAAVLFSEQRREIMTLLHEVVSTVEQAAIDLGYRRSKAFAGGSCKNIFCTDHPECRVLSAKGDCRHRTQARPSMSGFGINVGTLMKSCGWPDVIDTREPGPDRDSMSWVAGLVMIA